MPGALVHVGATIQCPHLGTVASVTTNIRVKVSGMAVVTATDQFTVAGCPFSLPPAPPTYHPCVRVQWTVPATRVFVNTQPVVLQLSGGLCLAADQAPQGPPAVTVAQQRVRGT